ncbi:glycosyltransferase family 2 protein [Lewinella sp. IMCC34183]|uniref:glycosyltransferase family 2 protein n=1 Tax=Lewinella sp. IMCC34183 TaxID=2248762 RepID=UPI00130030B0|nr:glycosyltransferase family A protein [Lewinella sp. IMCC34183]
MSSKEPKVSVIIPTFNRTEKVKRAIDSCLDQTYPNLEVVVVDDGSTDGSPAFLNQLARDEPRLIVQCNPENRGGNYCRNQGFKIASGEYVVFLDSDDKFHPDKIRNQIDRFGDDDQLDCVVAPTQVMQEHTDEEVRRTDGRIKWKPLPGLSHLEMYVTKRTAWLTHEPMWKKSFLDPQPFSIRLKNSQEYEFHCRTLAKGPRVDILDTCLATVYLHDGVERINGPSRKKTGKMRDHFKSKILSRYMVARTLKDRNLTSTATLRYLAKFSSSILVRCFRISPSHGFAMTRYLLKCNLDLLAGSGDSLTESAK